MHPTKATQWLRTRKPVERPRVRLVCLPYAGGACTIFHAWADMLPSDVEVVAVQPPGRQDRLREEPLRRVAAYVDELIEAMAMLQPAPTALFGHSFGACVAFEAAQRLQAAGDPPVALVVGASPAPPRIGTHAPIAALPEAAFLEAIHDRYKTPWALLRDEDLMSLTLPPLRADIEALEAYAYAPSPPLAVPITVLRGTRDARVPRAESDDQGWAAVTGGRLVVHEIDAGHFFVDTHREWVVSHVERALTA